MKPLFDDLVRSNGDALHQLCCRLVGPQEADDLWSKTLLAAFRSYTNFDGTNPGGWLSTIARNKAIDHYRSQGTHPHLIELIDDFPVNLEEPGQLDQHEWAELYYLPPQQRQAIVLRFLGELSYSQISRIMGLSIASARKQVSLGVIRLRSRLRNHIA